MSRPSPRGFRILTRNASGDHGNANGRRNRTIVRQESVCKVKTLLQNGQYYLAIRLGRALPQPSHRRRPFAGPRRRARCPLPGELGTDGRRRLRPRSCRRECRGSDAPFGCGGQLDSLQARPAASASTVVQAALPRPPHGSPPDRPARLRGERRRLQRHLPPVRPRWRICGASQRDAISLSPRGAFNSGAARRCRSAGSAGDSRNAA